MKNRKTMTQQQLQQLTDYRDLLLARIKVNPNDTVAIDNLEEVKNLFWDDLMYRCAGIR